MKQHWSEADIQANDIQIHYYRTGGTKPSADRSSIVLLHGITDNGLCWMRLVDALEKDFDFIMMDARGHGLSDHATTYLAKDHVKDVLGLIKALELNKPIIWGHSMGAVNAAYLAASHPEQVGALLLEDPPWPEKPESFQRDLSAWRSNIALQRTQDIEDIISMGQRDNPLWSELEFLAWAQAKRQVDPEVLSWLNEGQTLNNWRDLLATIECPILLITGDTDVRVSPEVAKEAKALHSSLSVAHVANAGHSIRRDQFAAYVAAVKPFLEAYL